MTLKNLLTEQAAGILAHKIVCSDQVRDTEPKAAQASACSMFELMHRAGEAAFSALLKQWPSAHSILVVAGNGNNAGDGYVLAKLAKQQGKKVVVVCQQPARELTGDAKIAQSEWGKISGKTLTFSTVNFSDFDVLVDALLGTGVTGQVNPTFYQVIQQINQAKVPVLSIDLPSGMHANTGHPLPIAVSAKVTVTFVATKPGLVSGIGKELSGEVIYADLAIGQAFFNLIQCQTQLVDWSMLQPLPPRPIHSNKGAFGKLLCIGGNQGMAGAIRLSAESALRCGVGLVKVYCHQSSSLAVGNGRPEIMTVHREIDQALNWCSCLVLGPGMGQDDWSYQQFSRVIAHLKRHPKPLVIDADGLNLLAGMADDSEILSVLASLPALVLTPHPGEAGRLSNRNTQEIEADRYRASRHLANKYQALCVLKGAGTIIQEYKANGVAQTWVCKGGNPGMATAGMGDLLTGVLGAFLAQGLGTIRATVAAVCAHAEAGDRVAKQCGQRGMIASDLLQPLRAIVNGL